MKILLIQLKRIGDLILTTPAIAAVREKFPDGHLTLVISSEGKALAPAIAGVNKLLVMPPGSARAEKFWNAQKWADVINHAADNHDVDLVLTGGSSPLEQTHISDIKSKVRHEVVDFSGRTNLLTLAALIGKARLLITVDSA